LRSTLWIIQEFPNGVHSAKLENLLALVNEAAQEDSSSLGVVKQRIEHLTFLSTELAANLPENDVNVFNWTIRLIAQLKDIHQELNRLAPWIELLPVPDRYVHLASLNQIPSLLHIQEFPDLFLSNIDNYLQEDN